MSSFSSHTCTTTQQSQPQPTFPLFTHLPTELRLKIWTLALPPPRLVPLYYLTPTNNSGDTNSGCTSPAAIPALLHVSQEARALAQEYYSLSFNLAGGADLFPPKIWFTTPKDAIGEADILYFPPLPGYLASYKHFIATVSVLSPHEFAKVRRLAVHEDLFVQIRREKGPFEWNVNAARSKDAWLERCLRDFWEYVRCRFWNVEELVFVARGMEECVLGDEGGREEEMVVDVGRRKTMGRPQEGLHAKVARVVGNLEEMEEDWIAPRWKVLAFHDHGRARKIGCAREQQNVDRQLIEQCRGRIVW